MPPLGAGQGSDWLSTIAPSPALDAASAGGPEHRGIDLATSAFRLNRGSLALREPEGEVPAITSYIG